MRLVLWSLRHRRQRHVLNALVIAVTTAVVIVFTSVVGQIIRAVRSATSGTDARVMINSKVVSNDEGLFPVALEKILRETEGVKRVEGFRITVGGTEGDFVGIIGEMESWAERPDPQFPVEARDVATWKQDAPMGALFSDQIASRRGLRVGQVAELTTDYGPMQVKVSGIVRGARDAIVVVHYKYLQEFMKDPGQSFYRLYTAPGDFHKVAPVIEERFAQAGHHVMLVNETQMKLAAIEKEAAVPVFFGCLGLFLMITTALTLANNSSITIRERRTEIAALRVIGFKHRTLFWSVIGECIIVGLVGAGIAVVVMLGLFRSGVQLTDADSFLKSTPIGPLELATGIATSILLPVIGAMPSALLSLRKPLATALRDSA